MRSIINIGIGATKMSTSNLIIIDTIPILKGRSTIHIKQIPVTLSELSRNLTGNETSLQSILCFSMEKQWLIEKTMVDYDKITSALLYLINHNNLNLTAEQVAILESKIEQCKKSNHSFIGYEYTFFSNLSPNDKVVLLRPSTKTPGIFSLDAYLLTIISN